MPDKILIAIKVTTTPEGREAGKGLIGTAPSVANNR
jgi:hypothetical protein